MQSIRKAVQLLGVVVAVLLISLPVFPQGSQGTIQGSVFDQTGGAVAGATVTIIDPARGSSKVLTTDSAGAYNSQNLTPGAYTVRGEAKGFQTVEHANVLVEVGQNIRVDLTLQPGAQTQTITVTSEAPAIDTTDATLGGTVSNASINALPLNGRNFERLLQLRPGMVVGVGSGSGQASSNGLRQGEDLFVVEGLVQLGPTGGNSIMNSNYRGGDTSSILPIDAIQEFNTSQNAKAEYGWRDGSVVNVGIRSGTNSLHGTAYAFGRDQNWDAANAFTGTQTPLSLEQFGGTAGGRIIKDKVFWFAGYEGLRYILGDANVIAIPEDVANGGDTKNSMVDACNFLSLNAGGGYNQPGSTQGVNKGFVTPLSARLSGITVDPVSGCTVTAGSPSFENLWPFNPNKSTSFNPPNVFSSNPVNNGVVKLDYAMNAKQHISGMFFIAKEDEIFNSSSFQLTPAWESLVPANTYVYTANWTYTPSSNWVNEARGGYAFIHNQTLNGDSSVPSGAPYPGGYNFNTGVTNPLYGGLPQIALGDFSGNLGGGQRTSVRGPEGSVNVLDQVSWLRGKHAFKFGFDFLDIIFDGNSYNQAEGMVSFKTSGPTTSLMNYLQGIPSSGKIFEGNALEFGRQRAYGAFIQDDFRMTSRVTVNAGLRWEYFGVPFERYNHIGNFDPTVTGNTPAIRPVGPGAPIPAYFKGDYTDFSPRLGVAWDVRGNGKTVVRAGASLMNALQPAGEIIDIAPFGANFPSLGVNTSGTTNNQFTPILLSVPASQLQTGWQSNGATPVFPVATLTSTGAFPGTYTGISCSPLNLSVAPGSVPSQCPTVTIANNFHSPYTAEWNLDIQRAITNNLTLDVAYVGNHGFDEPSRTDINQPPLGAGWNTPNANTGGVSPAAYCLQSANHPTAWDQCGVLGSKNNNGIFNAAITANEAATVPFQQFPYLSNIIQQGNQYFSNYNALQITANLRADHGLSFLAGYTLAHALDFWHTQNFASLLIPADNKQIGLGYGTSNNDIRNRLTFSPTYKIPGRKAPGQMLEGWAISSIVSLQGGQPWWAVDQTSDILGTGEFSTQVSAAETMWNFSGLTSAFRAGNMPIPKLTGTSAMNVCGATAQSFYAPGSQQAQLALAALANYGCYVQNGAFLTPPAFGTIGNAGKNIFRSLPYYNWDLSISKDWKFKERFGAQFRAEFFNILNRADYAVPGRTDPEGSQFGQSSATPDTAANNSVLGSGGPRAIQFGLKLSF
jgi:hypothetical protein